MTNVLKGSLNDKRTDQLMKIYGLQWVNVLNKFLRHHKKKFFARCLMCPTYFEILNFHTFKSKLTAVNHEATSAINEI